MKASECTWTRECWSKTPHCWAYRHGYVQPSCPLRD